MSNRQENEKTAIITEKEISQFKSFYELPFFTENQTRKAVFVAMLAYVLDKNLEEFGPTNFHPIKLIRKICDLEKDLQLPTCLQNAKEDDLWNDDWNKEIVVFDSSVQQRLSLKWATFISIYRFNPDSTQT